MSGWECIDIKCGTCEHIWDDVVERRRRDEKFKCPRCEAVEGVRQFPMKVNVSTAKTSQTIPDVVAKGRFDDIRRQQELSKERARARSRKDWESERKVDREIKELNK